MGRATQGVRLISLRGKDEIASVCRVPKAEDEDGDQEGDQEGEEMDNKPEGDKDAGASTEDDDASPEAETDED